MVVPRVVFGKKVTQWHNGSKRTTYFSTISSFSKHLLRGGPLTFALHHIGPAQAKSGSGFPLQSLPQFST